jgi:Fe-S-cluster containining protein
MPSDTASVSFALTWEGMTLEATIDVPAAVVPTRRMLPIVQEFTSAVVGMGESYVEQRGKAISCRAGCGACCRQLVPVAETEARHLRDLVAAMPEPRRTAVRDRFADAETRLAAAGMLARLRDPAGALATPEIGIEFFRLGIPCPFLEAESCSIHPDRPLSCREYLVTSPAENCGDPEGRPIDQVPTPGFAMTSLATLDGPTATGTGVRWVPLVLSLSWADANPEPPAAETGAEQFNKFLKTFTALKKERPPVDVVPPRPETTP